MRITVKGEKVEISTDQCVDPDHWDPIRHRLKPSATGAADRNNYLRNLELNVQEHKRDLVDRGIEPTAQALKNAYLGMDEENRGVLEIFDEHNRRCEELSGKDFAPGTIQRYKTCRKLVGQFIRKQYQRADIPVRSVNHRFIKELEHFLKTVRGCNHNTSIKYIVNFKKIILQAMAYGWITTDPFKNISFRYEEVDPEYLDERELEILRTKQFTIERVGRVRDVFVFCCFTGLTFCDVKSLTPRISPLHRMERSGSGNGVVRPISSVLSHCWRYR